MNETDCSKNEELASIMNVEGIPTIKNVNMNILDHQFEQNVSVYKK